MCSTAALPPQFPKGLRVLLVDSANSISAVEAQLRLPELQYAVTMCSSSTEALGYSRAAATTFDVVLAESDLVAIDDITGRAFIDAFEDTPVILMSESDNTDDVLRAVKMGAVDFLNKPLSLLKLKNIWQHHIRKMMQRTSLYDSSYSRPAYSEPVPAQERAISGCVPSSMTAPMAPLNYGTTGTDAGAPTLKCSVPDSTITGPQATRCSVDSPGTPNAAEPSEAISAGSIGDGSEPSTSGEAASERASFECQAVSTTAPVLPVQTAIANAVAAMAAARPPPLACKAGPFGPIVPVPPVSQWPKLSAGCVWGTPLGGPVAPPLPSSTGGLMELAPTTTATEQPILIKKPAPIPVQPAPLTTNAVPMPDNFLAKDEMAKAINGPIGLRLRKSNSFVDLINSTLSAEDEAAAANKTYMSALFSTGLTA